MPQDQMRSEAMDSPSADEKDVDIDVARLAGAVWARKLTILLCTVAFAGAAFAIAASISPSYKGDTQIVIESRESAYTRSGETGETSLSPESVESQVSLMTSAEVLGAVAERFGLARLPEFAAEPSIIDRLVTRVKSAGAAPSADVVAQMREQLQVYRKENQRVLVIEFSSHDPVLARDVPNAIASEYLSRQKGALLSSNTNATGWLEEEIGDLREAVRTAEGKVAAFRSSSDLLIGQNQNVLATQQLSEIATELSRTRAARAAAEGRAQSIRDSIERGLSLDSVSEVLSSPTIQALRERQIALKSQIADLSTTLLDGHPRIRSLRSQLRDVDAEIRAEAANVQSSLETEADAARQRETSLSAEMDRLKGDAARAGEEEVELRSLEREATAQSQLLESYLTRYREAVARGARDYLPVDARVFSQAQLPTESYFPKIVPITAAAGLGGFLFATLGVLLSELFSGRALRSLPQPVTASRNRWAPVGERGSGAGDGATSNSPSSSPAPLASAVAAHAAAVQHDTAGAESLAPGARQSRRITSIDDLAEAIVASEIARVLLVPANGGSAIDQGRQGSVALARQLAAHSRSIILVDLTPGNEAAKAMGVPHDAEGAGDLVGGTASFGDVIHRDLVTSAHVLASGGFSGSGPSEAEAEEIGVVLEALGKAYDCTMVDCGGLSTTMLQQLMDDDAALVVAVETGEEAAAEATVLELGDAGLTDVVVMHLGLDADPADQHSQAA